MDRQNDLNYRVENITPVLNVQNMTRSLSFYIDILGFKKTEWGDDNFTGINRDNMGLYLCKGSQGSPGTWIWIGFGGDIFSLHEHLRSRNVKIKLPPTNYSWAYEMQVEDPDGHILRFGTNPNEHQPFANR